MMNADVAAASVTEDETPTVKSVETSQSPDITKSPAKPNDQASDTKTSDKTKDVKPEVFTVHVAIQASDYDIERGNSSLPSRRRALPSRYRDYEDPDEMDDEEADVDYVPPAKTPSTGRPRGRPRKIVSEPGIAEGPEIQDTLNTEHGDGLIQPTPTPEVDCVPGNVQSEGKKTKSLRVKSGNFSHAELRTPRPYRCPENDCGQTFISQNWLARHMKFKHNVTESVVMTIKTEEEAQNEESSKKTYPCPVCSRNFTQEGNMRTHLRAHGGEKNYTCDICNKKYGSPEILKRHKMSHLGIKPYHCDVCAAVFSSNVALKEHKYIHNNIKKHTCEQCKRQFRQISVYQRHLMTHSMLLKYKCGVCDQGFKQKIYLRSHMKKHTGERPYKCDLCEKRFAHASDKTRHRKIHSGERPYGCNLCQARFTDPSSCRRHMKEHAGGTVLLDCQTCGETFKRKMALQNHINKCHLQGMLKSEMLPRSVYIPSTNGDGQNFNLRIDDQPNLVLLGPEGQEIQVIPRVVYTKDNQRLLKLIENDPQNTHQEVLMSQQVLPPEDQMTNIAIPDAGFDLDGDQKVEPLSTVTQQLIEQIESQLSTQEGVLDRADGQQVAVAYHVLHDDENQQIVEIQYQPVEQPGEQTIDDTLEQPNEDYVVLASGDQTTGNQITAAETNVIVTQALTQDDQTSLDVQTDATGMDLGSVSLPVKMEPHGHEYVQAVLDEVTSNISNSEISGHQSNAAEPEVDNDLDLSRMEIIPIEEAALEKQVADSITQTQTDGSLPINSTPEGNEEATLDSNEKQLQIISREMEDSQTNSDDFMKSHILTSDITNIYIEKPDFTSQEYYNWLSLFTDNCKQAIVPLSEPVFKNISQLHKTLTDVMASPRGILAHKENFKILMTISYDLNTIINKHLMCVLLTLENQENL